MNSKLSTSFFYLSIVIEIRKTDQSQIKVTFQVRLCESGFKMIKSDFDLTIYFPHNTSNKVPASLPRKDSNRKRKKHRVLLLGYFFLILLNLSFLHLSLILSFSASFSPSTRWFNFRPSYC